MIAMDIFYLEKITIVGIDEESAPRSPCEDLRVLLRDLTESRNHFKPAECDDGPFSLTMDIVENRLAFHLKNCSGGNLPALYISFNPYRKLISDYYLLCDSYVDARENSGPSRLEAIDMGRRALHNEGANLLLDRLAHRIEMDLPTARRLFTIMCVLHGRR